MNWQQQHPLLMIFVRISLLRQRPDELPASSFLFAVLLILNLLVGAASFLIEFDALQAMLRSLLDSAISLGFIYLLLLAVNKRARSLQTMVAVLGVGTLLSILSLPLLLALPAPRSAVGLAGIILYALFFWHITILGHIFRHALSVSIPAGLIISFAYVITVLSVFYSVFPVK